MPVRNSCSCYLILMPAYTNRLMAPRYAIADASNSVLALVRQPLNSLNSRMPSSVLTLRHQEHIQ